MLTKEQVQKFEDDGFLLVDDFLKADEADALRQACHALVKDMVPEEHNTVFTTLEMKRTSDDYFLNSGDKIRYFFEDGARDDKGQLKVDKHLSLNKIGHALHVLNPAFRKVTFNEGIKSIARDIGLVDPVVCQSMYIFKQPGIGGEVVPHQDQTFLYTDPMRLFGIWIALEDATTENGCLWFQPGSHKPGLYANRRMIRNPKMGEKGEPTTIFTCDAPKLDYCDYVPVPVKKGSLVIINGEVVHKSEQNTSNRSRHIYTFHMYDQSNTKYSKDNWLQPSKEVPFTPLYSMSPVCEQH
ncbi:phytanoyl-CoA dioxygenase domain-containing protein 1-like [Pecten maximus]|uniref:phytanoyl-CoA dioxygenase domain-containing protein 1-like n=1 Tax=Pecten maximus TaxID=6579 RepID=UPI0014586FCB|nr:phytanoyl-CoA dioxygenase domain-containing protein 1-like [Pecten maximus]